MSILKKLLFVFTLGMAASFALGTVYAQDPLAPPVVSQVGATTAQVSLPQSALDLLTPEEKAQVYFEYFETHKMCIMIYPTPAECLPKKTEVGKTSVTLSGLKPNTTYTVSYKKDNTIRCITAPCPGNEFASQRAEFTTKSDAAPVTGTLTRSLWLGSRGQEVVTLQTMLIERGYLKTEATGYFGFMTLQAVTKFQHANNISPIGVVGPLTRKALMNGTTSVGTAETFEGKVTAYSTACFADGECSISVDGKKVVTTIGWSQAVVGKVLGIPDFSSIENKIGSTAKVYAKKTADGYTLYGSADYYIEIK